MDYSEVNCSKDLTYRTLLLDFHMDHSDGVEAFVRIPSLLETVWQISRCSVMLLEGLDIVS